MEDLKIEDDEAASTIGVGPLLPFLATRELGLLGHCSKRKNRRILPESDEIAEEKLISKDPLDVVPCKLMGNHTRSTFLMVFSPDKELLASTHGDHNIYITEVKTGECVQTLKGHPRTPWCVAFHPSHNSLLASGCLQGHVRIWDLNGGSELWATDTVIASLAFHPTERLLVVATVNELHFWDWSVAEPFCKVSTKSEKEKVRYVKFDNLGHTLITGIANINNNSMHHHCSNMRFRATERAFANRRRPRNPLPFFNGPPNDSGSPMFGRYYRGQVHRLRSGDLVRDQIEQSRQSSHASSTASSSSTSASATATSTSASASQTLSDLAAAASDQLMAENAAAAAAAAITAAADAAEAAAEAASVLPRMHHRRLQNDEDPLLSDHPYGASTARRPPPTSHDSAQDPLLSDHPYGSPTGGRPPPTSNRDFEADLGLWPPLRSHQFDVQYRERRFQQLLMRFRHSPDSSFSEVNRVQHPTELFTHPDRSRPREANERFREVRERRLARRMAHRQVLLDRIINQQQQHGRNHPENASQERNRPIDEWAIQMRLQQQQVQERQQQQARELMNQGVRSFNERFAREHQQPSTDDNDDNDSITAQFGDFQEERPPRSSVGGPIEPNVQARPLSTIDANLRPSNSNSNSEDASNNDHNYTLSPAGSSTASNSATTSPIAGPSGSSRRSSQRQPDNDNRNNLDIARLNKHIDHMQRICRESLADGSVTHRRRQMVRIKHIKTMLEDLQRQIRSLRQSNSSRTNQNPDQESEEEELETAAQLGLDERNYDERVGEGHHMRNLARSGLTRALNRLNTHSESNSQGPNSHRLSRAHSQLVSQMRAMFRATEMSPDLASRGKSPIAIAKAKASQLVMEKTKKTATVVVKGQNGTPSNTKQELRALSQRLEKMLREQRESNPNDQANEHWDHRYEGLNNLSRPEPLPNDPRKRWRHMYEGTLPPSTSTPAPSSSSASAIASILDGMDSSESGSESDLDLSALATPRGRDFHRSPRFFQRRNSIRRWGPIEHQRSVSSRRFSPSRMLRVNRGQYIGPFVRNPGSNPLLNPESQDLSVDVEETAEDLGSDRLPPLREIIWRRHFRRRNVSLARMDDDSNLRPSESVPRNREGLSYMVDQMRIDQATNTPNSQQNLTGPGGPLSTAGLITPSPGNNSDSPPARINIPPIPPGSYWQAMNDPYERDHAAFRARFVNRPTDDPHIRVSTFRIADQHNNPYSMPYTIHRIQAWDFSKCDIPDLTDTESNIVVPEAKIHNDASVDISEDGTLLVTLVPSNLPTTTVVGVYGLAKGCKGRLFAQYSLESSPVSVSLSPTAKHLMVGFTTRSGSLSRSSLSPTDRNLMAQIFCIKMPWELHANSSIPDEDPPPRGKLLLRRDLHLSEPNQTYLNGIRWIPVAGQGMVYATNTGLLKILR